MIHVVHCHFSPGYVRVIELSDRFAKRQNTCQFHDSGRLSKLGVRVCERKVKSMDLAAMEVIENQTRIYRIYLAGPQKTIS